MAEQAFGGLFAAVEGEGEGFRSSRETGEWLETESREASSHLAILPSAVVRINLRGGERTRKLLRVLHKNKIWGGKRRATPHSPLMCRRLSVLWKYNAGGVQAGAWGGRLGWRGAGLPGVEVCSEIGKSRARERGELRQQGGARGGTADRNDSCPGGRGDSVPTR